MALIVKVFVNEKMILVGSAVRIKPKKGTPKKDEICTYRLQNGKEICHFYSDGAVPLAKRIIENAESV